jgi:uncharacterized protein
MIRKFFNGALALAGFVAASFATPQAVAATPKPALWEVSDRNTTIYLFGTIHLLPDNYDWQTRAIERAIERSDTLIVETIVDQRNPHAIAAEMARIGFSPGLPPIANRIHPEKRLMLEAAIAKSGVPRHVFDNMKTWAAAFTLLGVQFKELGLQGEKGVEQVLRDAFAAAGKPVGQLETNAEQLGFFDTLPQSAQRALLEGAIEPSEKMSGDFSEMLRSWVSGDVDAIAETFNRGLAASPELREALLRRRNENWSRWIAQRLATPGTVLVAVGAGHLAGPDSVQTMLQRGGYRIRRIQ